MLYGHCLANALQGHPNSESAKNGRGHGPYPAPKKTDAAASVPVHGAAGVCYFSAGCFSAGGLPQAGPDTERGLERYQLIVPIAEADGFGMLDLAAPVRGGVDAGKMVAVRVPALSEDA